MFKCFYCALNGIKKERHRSEMPLCLRVSVF